MYVPGRQSRMAAQTTNTHDGAFPARVTWLQAGARADNLVVTNPSPAPLARLEVNIGNQGRNDMDPAWRKSSYSVANSASCRTWRC
jgi:hypothetical protein